MTIPILNNINEHQQKHSITQITSSSGVTYAGQLFNFLKAQICVHSHTHEDTHTQFFSYMTLI